MLNKIYFNLRPVLPRGLTRRIRKWTVKWKRPYFQDTWPIRESAGDKPPNWPGWPEGKEFAFVLTHDVEGAKGLEKCQKLMEIEMEMGFRSSFNFIPEGEYIVSNSILENIWAKGFEVGVHDLKHDGKLYQCEKAFKKSSFKINEYFQKWNAVGFRSGYMLRNLHWLHDLNIQYDLSTFDTDPFEPQPDGVGTIFPFIIRKQGEKSVGYAELPYTLPQDSTLFLLLEEPTIDIWKLKIDWIAKCGGMALVNVHPDYVNFEGNYTSNEYPVCFYKELLDYVRSNYEGRYWHALPRQVSEFMYQCDQTAAMADFFTQSGSASLKKNTGESGSI